MTILFCKSNDLLEKVFFMCNGMEYEICKRCNFRIFPVKLFRYKTYRVMNMCVSIILWYAGITVPQVLQYLREFDAPAMQSCKTLPCGTAF